MNECGMSLDEWAALGMMIKRTSNIGNKESSHPIWQPLAVAQEGKI